MGGFGEILGKLAKDELKGPAKDALEQAVKTGKDTIKSGLESFEKGAKDFIEKKVPHLNEKGEVVWPGGKDYTNYTPEDLAKFKEKHNIKDKPPEPPIGKATMKQLTNTGHPVVDNITKTVHNQLINVEGAQFAKTNDGKLQMGADVKRLSKILGASLYGERGPKTPVKELLQNAYDSIRGMSNGLVKVNANDSWKNALKDGEGYATIEIQDNGIGMSRDELFSVFSDLGSSGKALQADASGGFGLAKAAPFLLTDKLKVMTAKKVGNQIEYSVFTSTPDDILDGKVEVDTKKFGLQEWEGIKDRFGFSPGVSTGTTVKGYWQEGGDKYVDTNGAVRFALDSQRSIKPPGRIFIWKNSEDLTGKLDFWGDETIPPIPENPVTTLQAIGENEKIPVADLDFYVSNESHGLERVFKQVPIEIHNNGIYQMTHTVSAADWADIHGTPKRIIVNTKSLVDEGHPDYPWNANRENVSKVVTKKIDDFISEHVIKPAIERRTQLLAHVYDTLPTIPNTNIPIYDAGRRLEPEELKTMMNNPWFQDIGRRINAVGNVFLEELKNVFLRKITGTGKLDAKTGDFIAKTSASKPLGHSIKRVGIVLSDDVHGVYIPKPGAKGEEAGIFINPFSLTSDIEQTPDAMAANVVHTIMHEITHDVAKGHNEQFTMTLGKTHAMMPIDRYVKALDLMKEIYDNGSGQLNPEFERLLQLYKESRGRDAVEKDIFGGEKSSR